MGCAFAASASGSADVGVADGTDMLSVSPGSDEQAAAIIRQTGMSALLGRIVSLSVGSMVWIHLELFTHELSCALLTRSAIAVLAARDETVYLEIQCQL